MNDIPVELWIRICKIACLDGGSTGRSLGQVSKYIRDVSRTVRLQSIAIHGVSQLCAFAGILEQQPAEYRRVRHLYISNRTPQQRQLPMGNLVLRQDQKKLFEENCIRILQLIAPTLQTFTLHTGSYPTIFSHIQLQALEELTIHGFFIFPPPGGAANATFQVQAMPVLKYLHLADCGNTFRAFTGMVPSLTHLRLSSALLPNVFEALIDPKHASRLNPLKVKGEIEAISRLQRIIIERGGPTSSVRTVRHPPRIQQWTPAMATGNVVLLQRGDDGVDPYAEAFAFWLDRLAGGEGCWDVGSKRFNLRVKQPDALI